jgi:hypothetical protein
MRVHLPSPESSTQPEREESPGSFRLAELEQPGAYDAAPVPEAGDGGEIEVPRIGGGIQYLEPLAVSSHHAVLYTVMHHLYEMPGARGAAIEIAVLGGESFIDGLQVIEDLFRAAHH